MQSTLPPPRLDWALFLDFDGTLVEIAEHPDAVHVPEDLPALLRAVAGRLGGALAVVSGRPVRQIDRHLDGKVRYVAGLHGLEYRATGKVEIAPSPTVEMAGLRRALKRFVAEHPGVSLEDKRASLALHYRARPELAEACHAAAVAAANGIGRLEVLAGKMVFEIKPAGIDKGRAVARFLDEPVFKGRMPVFIGDDVTDEHGFEAVQARGGHAIIVGDRNPTAATARFDRVADLFQWLRDLPDKLR